MIEHYFPYLPADAGLLDWMFIAICVVTLLVVAGAILFSIFYGIDYVLGSTREAECKVSGIFYRARHTESYYNTTLKMPMMKVVSDHWQLDIMTPDGVDDFVVDHEPVYHVGQKVWSRYRVGGITKTAIVIFSVRTLA